MEVVGSSQDGEQYEGSGGETIPDLVLIPSAEDREEYVRVVRGDKGRNPKEHTISGSSGPDEVSFLHPDYSRSWADDPLKGYQQELYAWTIHATLADRQQQLRVYKLDKAEDPKKIDHIYTKNPQHGGEPYNATTLALSPLLFIALFESGQSHHIESLSKDADVMEWAEAFSLFLQWGPRGARSPGFIHGDSASLARKWKTLGRNYTIDEIFNRMEEEMGDYFGHCYVEVVAPSFKTRLFDIRPPTVVSI